jgi:hypothetical protein
MESPSNLEIFNLIEGKIISNVVDVGNEFQLHLSDDYVLRITGTEINLFRTKNPFDRSLLTDHRFPIEVE